MNSKNRILRCSQQTHSSPSFWSSQLAHLKFWGSSKPIRHSLWDPSSRILWPRIRKTCRPTLGSHGASMQLADYLFRVAQLRPQASACSRRANAQNRGPRKNLERVMSPIPENKLSGPCLPLKRPGFVRSSCGRSHGAIQKWPEVRPLHNVSRRVESPVQRARGNSFQ